MTVEGKWVRLQVPTEIRFSYGRIRVFCFSSSNRRQNQLFSTHIPTHGKHVAHNGYEASRFRLVLDLISFDWFHKSHSSKDIKFWSGFKPCIRYSLTSLERTGVDCKFRENLWVSLMHVMNLITLKMYPDRDRTKGDQRRVHWFCEVGLEVRTLVWISKRHFERDRGTRFLFYLYDQKIKILFLPYLNTMPIN